MFGLGATELVVILVLALILLGPKKLPDVASGLGKAIRQFRKATQDLTSQLDIDDDVKQPFRELKAALRDEPAPYVPPAPIAHAIAAAPAAVAQAPAVATGSSAAGLPGAGAEAGLVTAAEPGTERAVEGTPVPTPPLKGS